MISLSRNIEAAKLRVKADKVEYQNRDFLYYGILNFVSRIRNKETQKLLKNDYAWPLSAKVEHYHYHQMELMIWPKIP